MKKYVFKGLLNNSIWLHPAFIEIDDKGCIAYISSEPNKDHHYVEINGYALPGIPNAHSHAFQYAMAGICEYNSRQKDTSNFWSWRNKMYEIALSISPVQLENIATQLYSEMIRHGYTHVTEFHYLHHDKTGSPYLNPAEMGLQLINAAKKAGIRITLVPILYQLGGFNSPPLPDQKRFISKDLTSFHKLLEATIKACSNYELANIGVGIHSLRAVSPDTFVESYHSFDENIPFHIHVAEQIKEVEQSLQFHRKRPVEWLLENVVLKDHCNLVHATHMTPEETKDLAQSGAYVVLCPSTEANLGDGFFNFNGYQEAGGKWCIGTDSHIGLNPFEELRLLDYGQRLRSNNRQTFTLSPDAKSPGNAFCNMVISGRRAGGWHTTSLFEKGQPFDALIIDAHHPLIRVTSIDRLLDTIVYTSDTSFNLGTMINGEWTVKDQKHRFQREIADSFEKTMRTLNIR